VGGAYALMHTALHPLFVAKTIQQTTSAKKNTLTVLKELTTQGGLYRGFGTTVASAISSKLIYYAALDKSRSFCYDLLMPMHMKEERHSRIARECGHIGATLLSQIVSTPADVVSISDNYLPNS
ncbi:solute carrier family 25 member 44-like, partial [Trifolium medium]|nr:solute carrier family 25 member 44-like [Trifolium medium]